MKNISNSAEFNELLTRSEKPLFFIFYSEKSKDSLIAIHRLEALLGTDPNALVYKIDVHKVNDIHHRFKINMVPVVLVTRGGKESNIVYGLQTEDFYAQLLADSANEIKLKGNKATPQVIAYTSDGCPWCVRAIDYLRKNNVLYREVNVSRNPTEATALFARTGQQGTPQLNINGQYVIGFDQMKINQLLGINSNMEKAV